MGGKMGKLATHPTSTRNNHMGKLRLAAQRIGICRRVADSAPAIARDFEKISTEFLDGLRHRKKRRDHVAGPQKSVTTTWTVLDPTE